MVGMNTVLVAINAWFIVQMLRERHDETAFEVLEVSPTDEYLRHTLRVHGADILKFNPGFVHDPSATQDAFLVQKGDETVGVVLLREDGETAHVLLDYVTPRYRDFSPGEFVWRRSGLLTRARHPARRHPARHGRRLLRPSRLRPRGRRPGSSTSRSPFAHLRGSRLVELVDTHPGGPHESPHRARAATAAVAPGAARLLPGAGGRSGRAQTSSSTRARSTSRKASFADMRKVTSLRLLGSVETDEYGITDIDIRLDGTDCKGSFDRRRRARSACSERRRLLVLADDDFWRSQTDPRPAGRPGAEAVLRDSGSPRAGRTSARAVRHRRPCRSAFTLDEDDTEGPVEAGEVGEVGDSMPPCRSRSGREEDVSRSGCRSMRPTTC